MNILLLPGWYILITYVLLETDAFIEWANCFHLKFFKYKEYQDWKNNISAEVDVKYKHFILAFYKNFWISLLTCQECLIIWLNILGTLILFNNTNGWSIFGFNCLISILGLASFKYLLKKFYE